MKKTHLINFAAICVEVRENSQMTPKEISKLLGVSVGNYKKYERGEVRPGPEAAFRLAGLHLTFSRLNLTLPNNRKNIG
ncbi:MAG: helix-turn-helix transcriptional regulator [Blastocatellia bacterium]